MRDGKRQMGKEKRGREGKKGLGKEGQERKSTPSSGFRSELPALPRASVSPSSLQERSFGADSLGFQWEHSQFIRWDFGQEALRALPAVPGLREGKNPKNSSWNPAHDGLEGSRVGDLVVGNSGSWGISESDIQLQLFVPGKGFIPIPRFRVGSWRFGMRLGEESLPQEHQERSGKGGFPGIRHRNGISVIPGLVLL